jgi:hypothetical protein
MRRAIAVLLTLATVPLLAGATSVPLLAGATSATSVRDGGTYRVAVPAIGDTGLPRFATIDPALTDYIAEPLVLRPA